MKKSRIGIIGVGPRGLTLLERIVANERQRPSGQIEILLFEPNAPGAGCHDPAQSDIHLVNTVAGQLTVFADASVVDAGPVMEGPSFHQWLNQQSDIGAGNLLAGARASPDGYYPRGLFGRYLQWAFRYVCALAPPHVTIIVKATAVTRAHRDDDAWILETADAKIRVDYLFLTTGHTKPSHRVAQWRASRGRETLVVDDPYPIRSQLAAVGPDMAVAVEGMGLTSFDVIAELTIGRGGRFVTDASGDKQYLRSGREPRIVVFSRSGVPLSARAVNQKGVSNQYRARFLLLKHVRALRTERKLDFVADVLPLLVADMEYAYYDAYLRERTDATVAAGFCKEFAAGDARQRRELIERAVPESDRFSWQRLAAPVPEPVLASRDTFAQWLKRHLLEDLREARKGNLDSPLKAACDVLRDLRDNLRAAVEFGGLTPASHRWVLAEFMPVMNRLAVGPPQTRVGELLALMEAGVLEADFGPGAECRAPVGGGLMRISAARWPGHSVEVHALVKARISMHSPQDDASPLLRGLLDDGHVRLFRNGDFHAGGIEIDRNHNWVSESGSIVRNAWALGIPTEGVKWCTFVVPRPGVNSTAIVDAGRAVAGMLAGIRSGEVERDAHEPLRLRTEAQAWEYASLYGSL
ncbi:MAG: FAD/NAD(P)-binding protein [Betaproteobacteria bacterium]